VAKCITLAITGNKKDVPKNLFLLTPKKSPAARTPMPAAALHPTRRKSYLEPLPVGYFTPKAAGGSEE
jgi:hypothetical protein